jgi:thioredoxin-like negative regulator of GroEL
MYELHEEKNVLDLQELGELLQQPQPLIVLFREEVMGIGYILNLMIEDLLRHERVQYVKVNLSPKHLWRSPYQLTQLPTLMLFRQGKEVARITDIMPKYKLATYLQQFLQQL